MKQLFEFFPIVLFFIAYKVYGIYVATEVMIAATTIGVALTWLKYRQVTTMQWITLVLAVVLGGATIYLHDERFLKWKLSIVEWLFGIAFVGSQNIAMFGRSPVPQKWVATKILKLSPGSGGQRLVDPGEDRPNLDMKRRVLYSIAAPQVSIR